MTDSSFRLAVGIFMIAVGIAMMLLTATLSVGWMWLLAMYCGGLMAILVGGLLVVHGIRQNAGNRQPHRQSTPPVDNG